MTFQAQPTSFLRNKYLILLSTATLVSCLSSAKTVANSQHPLSALVDHDDASERHLRTIDAGPAIEQDGTSSEERIDLSPLSTDALQVLDKSVEVVSPLSAETVQDLDKSVDILSQKLIEKAADELFASYEVGEVKEEFLHSPVYRQLVDALEVKYKDNPEMVEEAIIATLATKFEDLPLLKMLNDATKVEETASIAKSLKIAQLRYWANSGKSTDDVFNMLKLDKDGSDVLLNPLLDAWIAFVQIHGKAYSLEPLFTTLGGKFDERLLADVLVRMKTDPSNMYVKRSAEAAIEARINAWIREEKSSDDVYSKVLRLDAKEEEPLESPVLDLWLSYMQKQKQEPMQEPEDLLLTALLKRYKDEAGVVNAIAAAKQHKVAVTDKLESKLVDKFFDEEKSWAGMYKLLHLNKAKGVKIFEHRALNTWVLYTIKACEKSELFKGKNPYEVLMLFLKRYGDLDPAALGKADASVETSATSGDAAAKLVQYIKDHINDNPAVHRHNQSRG